MKTVSKIFATCAMFIAHVELCNSQIYANEKPISNNYSKVLKTTIPEIVMPSVNVDSDSLAQINDTIKDFRFGVSFETEDITGETFNTYFRYNILEDWKIYAKSIRK